MLRKNIGWMLFVGGLLMQELSYMVDIRLLHVLGGVLWPIGITLCIKSMIRHNQKNRNNNQENT